MRPKDYDIRTLQLHLLGMLRRVDEAFRNAGVSYYLIDGSLLGAVRDGGFIPWDDDVDIGVPRADYERLCSSWRSILPDGLEFVSFETDPDYPLHFGKIQDAQTTIIERPHLYYLGGAYIDVFPIDGAPSSPLAQRLHTLRYDFWRKMLYFRHRDPYRHGHGPSSWLPLAVRALWSPAFIQRRIKRIMMSHPFESSPLAAVNHNDGRGSMVGRRNVLGDPTPVSFEGFKASGMADNHAYLSKLFGDYMTPPPPGKRHQHKFYYLDLNKPYRDFDPEAD